MADADVLVVEDDLQLRTLLVAALSDAGFRTRAAPHGAAALALLEEPGVGLILLDIGLPILDGRAFLRRRQRRPDLAAIPVLVLTARADIAEDVTALGANRVLRKPVGLDELLAAIRGLVRHPRRSGLPGQPEPAALASQSLQAPC